MNLTKQKTASAILAVAMVAAAVLLYPRGNAHSDTETVQKSVPNHQQEVYIYALEWCESRGVTTAVNPKDRDNTPSYYSWQWKPSTFFYFAVKYGVLEKGTTLAQATELMKQYDLQHAVITAMVMDARHVDWSQQFPDCTKNKIGRPPL